MGLCEKCKDNECEACTGKATARVFRKGLEQKAHISTCSCQHHLGAWRGEPQPLPTMPFGRRRH